MSVIFYSNVNALSTLSASESCFVSCVCYINFHQALGRVDVEKNMFSNMSITGVQGRVHLSALKVSTLRF